MMLDPILESQGLSAGYGAGAVVRDLDLNVGPGEVVALLGPNGAGKSTTLLALAGELRPLAGTIMWDGGKSREPLYRRARAGLAFIPEDHAVFRGLTVAQNIAVSRTTTSRSRLVTLFPELAPLQQRRVGLLSGGEQRMLAVGRALSGRCRLLLADELSLGLAPRTVARLLRAIRAAADEGVGALLVEQHVHRILDIADRVYVLGRGRVQFAGTADETRAHLDTLVDHYSRYNTESLPARRVRTVITEAR